MLVLAATLVTPTHAKEPPALASGDFIETVTFASTELVGLNVVTEYKSTFELDGTFAGTGTIIGREVVHIVTLQGNVHAQVNCTCIVSGKSGTLVLEFTGRSSLNAFPPTQATYQDQWAIMSAGGDLATITGSGTFSESFSLLTGTGSGSYSGRVH